MKAKKQTLFITTLFEIIFNISICRTELIADTRNAQIDQGQVDHRKDNKIHHPTNSYYPQQLMSDEQLSQLISKLLVPVIDGFSYHSEAYNLGIDVCSIEKRKQDILDKYNFDIEQILKSEDLRDENASLDNISFALQFLLSGTGILALGPRLIKELWTQARVVSIIAALHGHDVNEQVIQKKIADILLTGESRKLPICLAKDLAVKSFSIPYSDKVGAMIGSIIPNFMASFYNFVFKKAVNKTKKRIVKFIPIESLSGYFFSKSTNISEIAVQEFSKLSRIEKKS